MISRWISRGSFWLVAGQLSCEGLGLVRNVALARLLGPDEMGIVAALALTMRLMEMVSDLAADRLLIQARDGDRLRFQATAQSLQIIRGVASGLLLALLAIPTAAVLGQTAAAGAFAAMALVPVARGWMHLDYRRWQRNMNFRPLFVVEFGAAVALTVVTACFALLTQGHVAIVWGSLVQGVTLVLLSHVVAQQPFVLAWDRPLVKRFVQFGVPLVANGLIQFAVFQGDRIVIALSCPLADLGRYAIAFQMALIPSLVVSRIVSSLWLPVLSRVQRDVAATRQEYRSALGHVTLVASCFSVGFLTWGDLLIPWLYGTSFAVSRALIAWIAIMQGVRMLRAVPSVAAVARADTRSALLANCFRISGVAVAIMAGYSGCDLRWIVAAGCGGEVIAMLASVALLHWRHALPVASSLWALALTVVAPAGAWMVLHISHGAVGSRILLSLSMIGPWVAMLLRGFHLATSSPRTFSHNLGEVA